MSENKATIDLKNLDCYREGNRIEAKSAKGGFPDSLWETYSAFANTDGGVLLLGVEEKSDHTLLVREGLADADKMMRTFWRQVNNRQKISHNIVTDRMVYVAQVDGKDVLVIEIPRAERMTRPVYTGLDPRLGTYRRWGEGDHLCTIEEVTAMMRDASPSSLDARPIQNMDTSVFCKETVRAYRQVFKNTNLGHLWSNLDDELFLRRINATATGEDGQYHPTEAGLLMFGYEYEIVNRFPQYFLDYQEDRMLIGVTRWKDRIVSSSGDWSGNIFDFLFKVLPKLCSDLKVPFVLRGMYRIDDTPIHKLLREATVNCLAHADFNGRQGVVISKNDEGFVFSNPGRLRIPKNEAIGGGVSDPRNGTILKMLSLLRFGERAGSGLNGIMHVWEKVFHTSATIVEKSGEVDRTILTLPFDGHEQDVEAMLQFYDDPEELFSCDSEVNVVTSGSNVVTSGSNMATPGSNVATSGSNMATSKSKKKMSASELQELILAVCQDWKTIDEIAKATDYSPKYLRGSAIKVMTSNKVLEMLYPDKPNHPKQKYKALR